MTINFNKKRVLVIGLGDTGQSVLNFLMNKECVIHAIDTRPTLENLDEIKEKFKKVKFSVGETFNEDIINDIENGDLDIDSFGGVDNLLDIIKEEDMLHLINPDAQVWSDYQNQLFYVLIFL
jgi:siroheme synthase (precorrin-2 oxidase/ferrochelatase)